MKANQNEKNAYGTPNITLYLDVNFFNLKPEIKKHEVIVKF